MMTPKIRFVPSEFEEYKKILDHYWSYTFTILKNTRQDFYPMWYSKLNDVEEVNKIVNYIGIDSRKSKLIQITKRQNPTDLKDKVENIDELREYARTKGLEHHLF
jgi:hypothetical protein